MRHASWRSKSKILHKIINDNSLAYLSAGRHAKKLVTPDICWSAIIRREQGFPNPCTWGCVHLLSLSVFQATPETLVLNFWKADVFNDVQCSFWAFMLGGTIAYYHLQKEHAMILSTVSLSVMAVMVCKTARLNFQVYRKSSYTNPVDSHRFSHEIRGAFPWLSIHGT